MDKFLIIDGNNIAFRAYYALPSLQNSKKEKTSVLFGFSNILIKTIQELKPKYLAVAFDKGKQTFRHKMYKFYKAKRNPTPEDLIEQMPKLKSLLKTMNIKVLEEDEIEADDIIGILSKSFKTENYILSADKDILQLVNKNTTVIVPKKGVTETVYYTPEKLKEDMGITPSQIIELKALMGDPSDNIPGVLGVGEKTALNLLKDYETIDGVYAHIDELKGKTKEKLIDDKESAYMSRKLATIFTDFDLNVSQDDFLFEFPYPLPVFEEFSKYELNTLTRRQDIFNFDIFEISKPKEPINKLAKSIKLNSILDIKKAVEKLLENKEFAVHVCDDKISLSKDLMEEYVISFDYDLLNPGLDVAKVLNELNPLFNSDRLLILFNTKELLHILHKYSIELTSDFYDISIAKYLVTSGIKYTDNIESFIKEYNLNPNTLASDLIFLKKKLEEEVRALNLQKIYQDIEIPLVKVLYEMELEGFKIDRKELIELEKNYQRILKELTNEIYILAGTEFNINSPKQMSDILFNKLQLKDPTHNKRHSTKADVLNDMVGQHPVVEKLIKYRQIAKLYSTYISAFLELLDNNDKIHTIFNQTLTATGRLSSSDPNLQNIPVKTEEGKLIRKMFISSFENGKIVSADYSQIELRLLAAFSGDEELIKSYNNNEDIHKRTAASIFNMPYQLITEEYRKKAKAVNFGIVYGISDFGLSKNTHTTREEAKDFIEKYYLKYPRIKQYMESNIEFAKKNKYVKTYFGRIRNIPELFNPKKVIQQFGERAAMNMPLQGTASDIIKIAMIKVYNAMKKENLKSKLILTIHDELIVDTHPDEIDIVQKILKEEMESVVTLNVKLNVDIGVGDSWYNV